MKSAKYPIKGRKTQATDWEEIFANHIFDKGLISNIQEDLTTH